VPRKESEPIVTPGPAPEEAATGLTDVQKPEHSGPITEDTLKNLDFALVQRDDEFMALLNRYGVPTLEDLSEAQGLEAIENLKK
jgi:hypothetical protein